MKSLADQLPADIARSVHPDWRKNEADYWAVRDQLLPQYEGQWVAFADGGVIASGASAVAVFEAAQKTDKHPFLICVGREDEPTLMRRDNFAYDAAYQGEPLPVISVEFRKASGSTGILMDRVIPDTGADASAMPWADCQQLPRLFRRCSWTNGWSRRQLSRDDRVSGARIPGRSRICLPPSSRFLR
jgi:hypothetical protein